MINHICVCGWPVTEKNVYNHAHCHVRVHMEEAKTIKQLRKQITDLKVKNEELRHRRDERNSNW